VPTYDITEDVPYDISIPSTEATFELTDTAYDIVIDDLPFIVKVNNQDPYVRQTAPYKKDQFDNSPEPGEQSLTGWWLRSQTSWHNGAGISFYEPGTDYQHVTHRFADSRGIDIWTIGEATLLPEVVDVYTGGNLINAAVGNDGARDVLVSGDSAGVLRKITFTGDTASAGPTSGSYTISTHSAYPFSSVTTDGTNYYATCSRAIHTGPIGSDSDALAFKYSNTDVADTFIQYVKGYVLFGFKQSIYNMNSLAGGFVPSGASRTTSSHSHTSGTDALPSGVKTHINPNWIWNDATAGPNAIYMCGNAGSNGEIWQVLFDEATNNIDMPGATMVVSLPDGENVNKIHYYLGVLAVGTNKGLRICPINANGQVAIGPLLYENGYYPVKGFTEAGNYIYAATKSDNESETNTHACLIRVDLSAQFDDGTYAFAHDLEYRSSVNETYTISNKALTTNVATLTTNVAHDFDIGNTVTVSGVDATFNGTYTVTAVTSTTFSYTKTASNVTSVASSGSVSETASDSEATEVYSINGRLVMVVEEDSTSDSGELHIESETLKRDTGWFTTGKIRYGTVEPKFFRYINVQCTTGQGDNITIYTIDKSGLESSLAVLSEGLSNQDILISNPSTKQEYMSFKFVFNNVTTDQQLPILEAYQIKATPATRRQRLYQYPLSCFDHEMDKFNSLFGYSGRAMEFIQRMEAIEETGKFVTVTDYRTGEQYQGVIEEVRFKNESSPDKDSSGFGGTLLVTVRKL
jgi:hypothetical protein